MGKEIIIHLTKNTDISEAISKALNPEKVTLKDFHKIVKCSKKHEEDNIKFGEMISENGISRNIAG